MSSQLKSLGCEILRHRSGNLYLTMPPTESRFYRQPSPRRLRHSMVRRVKCPVFLSRCSDSHLCKLCFSCPQNASHRLLAKMLPDLLAVRGIVQIVISFNQIVDFRVIHCRCRKFLLPTHFSPCIPVSLFMLPASEPCQRPQWPMWAPLVHLLFFSSDPVVASACTQSVA